MNKARLLMAVLFALAATGTVFASEGDRELSFGAGLAIPGDDLGDAVDTGIDLQAAYLIGVHPNVDVGGQADLIVFGDDTRVAGPITVKTKARALTGMAVATFHPAVRADVKPYGLAGLGLAFTHSDVTVGGLGFGAGVNDGNDLGVTLTFGGGVDFNLSGATSAGFSLRYQTLDVEGLSNSYFLAMMGHLRFSQK